MKIKGGEKETWGGKRNFQKHIHQRSFIKCMIISGKLSLGAITFGLTTVQAQLTFLLYTRSCDIFFSFKLLLSSGVELNFWTIYIYRMKQFHNIIRMDSQS
jgi:hypothetical protein